MTTGGEEKKRQQARDTKGGPAKDRHGVDRRLLEILVCPITKGTLDYRADTQELVSRSAGLAYPIQKGVPLMTKEAARELTEAELAKAKATKK